MKPSMMRPPALRDIYDQKLTYNNHLKKLSQIRQDRKNQLTSTQNRNQQLQHIKQGKSRTFAQKFNEQNVAINQSNIKFLVKLQKIKPFTHYSSLNVNDRTGRDHSQMTVKSTTKRKIIETEKENSRMFYKMKSVSSNLGRERMASQYAKAQKIKDRLAKYVNQDNRVELKSEKVFGNKSVYSNKSLKESRESTKRNLAQHYKRSDILKNRISNTDRYLKKKQDKLLPSLKEQEVKKIDEYQDDFVEEKKEGKERKKEPASFFTTQPAKKRRAVTQVRKVK